MLSLRTTKGLDLEKFEKDFKEDILKSKSQQIEKLTSYGMLEVVDGFLRITEHFFHLSNSIIVELM